MGNSKGKKHYTVYQTINLLNGKKYIGTHVTDNPYDGYLGSGKHLKNAIKKYGKENFKKEVLYDCKGEEEMYEKEAKLITEEVVKDKMYYNKLIGGDARHKIGFIANLGYWGLRNKFDSEYEYSEHMKKIGQNRKVQSSKITKVCSNCKKEFETVDNKKQRNKRFCTLSCSSKHREKTKKQSS
jgi:hypothetical protein